MNRYTVNQYGLRSEELFDLATYIVIMIYIFHMS